LLARKSIGYVPDDRRIFADLTVGENLEIAARSSEPFDYAQDKTRDDAFPLGTIEYRSRFLIGKVFMGIDIWLAGWYNNI
jgi:hypothetical protein